MKGLKVNGLFSICILFGFMLAVYFNSTTEDELIESRDTWEIREDYLTAQKNESKLLQEIQKVDEIILQYETQQENSKRKILQETIDNLRMEAGLGNEEGSGIIITISVIQEFIIPGQSERFISPNIIRKLINELNMNGAQAISIADQRVVNTSTIRIINGETKIDGYPLRTFPIEIKAITEDKRSAQRLYNYMQVSTISDDFFVDNLRLSISEPRDKIVIPSYKHNFNINKMETVIEEGDK